MENELTHDFATDAAKHGETPARSRSVQPSSPWEPAALKNSANQFLMAKALGQRARRGLTPLLFGASFSTALSLAFDFGLDPRHAPWRAKMVAGQFLLNLMSETLRSGFHRARTGRWAATSRSKFRALVLARSERSRLLRTLRPSVR